MVCEHEDDRIVVGSQVVEWRRGKKWWEQRRYIVAHRERKRACVRYRELVAEEGKEVPYG